jgi:imidazolonepropionase
MISVLRNISSLARCCEAGGQSDLHAVARAALVWEGPTIRWVGAEAELPAEYRAITSFDARGCLVVPGLIDCHTHLGFGGWRSNEFVQRSLGWSYHDIQFAGGGIHASVAATRAATEEELFTRSENFLREIVRLGVSTVECKSGYGLNDPTEQKLLRVYARLAAAGPVKIVSTFLGAHVIPIEYRDRRSEYVDLLIDETIPAVARDRLATCCDVFVDAAAFTIDEARRILRAGSRAGLAPKMHADQLSWGGGAELAAEVKAISADHLEYASDAGIAAMSARGVVAVTLPLATLYLRQRSVPARKLIDAGVAVAVATDFNPGSAPSYHLPLAMTLACVLQSMSPAEAVKGATLYAARAIGIEARAGSLESGKAADFAMIDAPSVEHWLYHFRPNACLMTVIDGSIRWLDSERLETRMSDQGTLPTFT